MEVLFVGVGTISWRGLSPIVVLRGMIAGEQYRSILTEHFHCMFQTLFPGELPVFQDDNAHVHATCCIQTCLGKHDDKVENVTWCPQLPDFNIVETL